LKNPPSGTLPVAVRRPGFAEWRGSILAYAHMDDPCTAEETIALQAETIIVADDHPVFRDGLTTLLTRMLPDAEITSTDTFDDALALARSQDDPPTMFILDLFFTRRSIKEALPALRREFASSSIVVVSMADDKITIDDVIACGVNGFINKAVHPEVLTEALAAVRDGEVVTRMPEADFIAAPTLTDRQSDVLRYIAEGKSNKEIAIVLGISPFTVRIHVSALFKTLGVTTRAAAVSQAINDGLLPSRS
jgi:DNA-binding NarL/FixJ family response regulator